MLLNSILFFSLGLLNHAVCSASSSAFMSNCSTVEMRTTVVKKTSGDIILRLNEGGERGNFNKVTLTKDRPGTGHVDEIGGATGLDKVTNLAAVVLGKK